MLEAALCAGICAAGVDAIRVGVLPTPAVAYLTRTWGALGGVVLSASHNPFADNGIKFFSADGFKLPMRRRTILSRWSAKGRHARHRLGATSAASARQRRRSQNI